MHLGEEARLVHRCSSAALTSANCALLAATLLCTRAASSSLTFVRILGCYSMDIFNCGELQQRSTQF